jgi:hypothetical protein
MRLNQGCYVSTRLKYCLSSTSSCTPLAKGWGGRSLLFSLLSYSAPLRHVGKMFYALKQEIKGCWSIQLLCLEHLEFLVASAMEASRTQKGNDRKKKKKVRNCRTESKFWEYL